MNRQTSALWLATTRHEATQLIKRLWPDLAPDERSRLVQAIRKRTPATSIPARSTGGTMDGVTRVRSVDMAFDR